jgi:hypothetical protein
MSTIAEVKTLCREDCCAEIYRICNLPEAPNYQNNYTKKKNLQIFDTPKITQQKAIR